MTTASRTNPRVDAFLDGAGAWREEIRRLRAIALGSGLTEELKWKKPCYALNGKNVVIIIPFKASCALMFCKGALLKDAKKVLGRPGENSQSGRWVKFTSVREIDGIKPTLTAYIKEAIAAERAGLEVAYKKTADYRVPQELKNAFGKAPRLKAAFEALTPGRQRGYLIYFAAPKQSKTRDARIAKCTPRIIEGRGLLDDYLARKEKSG